MKYLNKLFTITVVIATLSACNRDEIFEREQYKHVVSLISETEGIFNIFSEEHDASAKGDAEGYTEGYIAASVGGTLLTTQPITLNLAEDASLLELYNNSNYGAESFQNAHYLSEDRYSINEHIINIPAGERTGSMKIRLRADGLSPDSVYFIPLRVVKCSAYELNIPKSAVLYQIHLKNFWASTAAYNFQYNHLGIRYEQGSDVAISSMMMKHVHPVSANEVRIFAGIQPFEKRLDRIEEWAMRLTMDDDGNVTITPWGKNSRFALNVTQIDGDEDYPNVFRLIDDGWGNIFKTFLLCYEYVDRSNGVTYRMQEELRIEHK